MSARETFAEVRARVDATVRKVFPAAKRTKEWGFEGWRIARPAGAPRPPTEGTIPSGFTFIGLAERKEGPTLYVWWPGDHEGLKKRAPELTAAGFKVMVGCLVYTKKQPYPIAAVEKLLRDIKKRDGL